MDYSRVTYIQKVLGVYTHSMYMESSYLSLKCTCSCGYLFHEIPISWRPLGIKYGSIQNNDLFNGRKTKPPPPPLALKECSRDFNNFRVDKSSLSRNKGLLRKPRPRAESNSKKLKIKRSRTQAKTRL